MEDEHLGDTEDEVEKTDDGEYLADITDDGSSPIRFQERSLRDYFRAMDTDESGLRTPPSSAHLTIFKMCVMVLCGSYEEQGKEVGKRLKEYAANFWIQHFFDIDLELVSERNVIDILESLALILTDHGNGSRVIELYGDPETYEFRPSEEHDSTRVDGEKSFLDRVLRWTAKAANVEPKKFSYRAWRFTKEANTFPGRIMVPLAFAHISNWFQQKEQDDASFEFAMAGLKMVRPVVLSHDSD